MNKMTRSETFVFDKENKLSVEMYSNHEPPYISPDKHFVVIYNDVKDTNVAFSATTSSLKSLIEYLNGYLNETKASSPN